MNQADKANAFPERTFGYNAPRKLFKKQPDASQPDNELISCPKQRKPPNKAAFKVKQAVLPNR